MQWNITRVRNQQVNWLLMATLAELLPKPSDVLPSSVSELRSALRTDGCKDSLNIAREEPKAEALPDKLYHSLPSYENMIEGNLVHRGQAT